MTSTGERRTQPKRPSRRSYDSSRRRASAEETRAAVFAAAAELFSTRGWSATGMRDVARAAGVSVETVYASAGTKSDLLERAIDIAVVGDDEPVPLAQRPEFQAMGAGSLIARAAATARLLTNLHKRVAPLDRTLGHAALTDPELAHRQREIQTRRRASFHDGLTLVVGREPEPELVDGIWAVGSPDVYLLLVETAGWSPERYQSWLAESILRLIVPLPTLDDSPFELPETP
ncbi:TetR/AcrR family transcriptional regulator [Aldersonia sp. NBC_00410]|uniref:TetR/AcrR family transcriptional regulator n=1 Tax=Aldersonia sp. NBC_00410 TaxID=2975954 RepID=UPI00224DAA83|nr:helix-turn-helix domain-containing protein [Aldersonia sp. NBC_00410]MCX5045799.1 TetR/AcrR family transcriptional regulator [Aldersonia sp. NBC_00410]